MNGQDKESILYLQPNNTENYKFLLNLYFGYSADSLDAILQRAYLDFNRTIRGISSYLGKEDILKECRKVLRSELEDEILKNQSQENFDAWHERLCVKLKDIYLLGGFPDFHIGQSQKWINMTLKYIFLYPELAEKYKNIYKFCHVPIDNIILENLVKRGVHSLLKGEEKWSQLDDYERYFKYQVFIRDHYKDSPPLAVEFKIWQDERQFSKF